MDASVTNAVTGETEGLEIEYVNGHLPVYARRVVAQFLNRVEKVFLVLNGDGAVVLDAVRY